MSDRRTGKPSPSRLKALLGNNFGASCERLLVGPGPGLDAAVLELMDGSVMAIAEDPIFPAPGLPLEITEAWTEAWTAGTAGPALLKNRKRIRSGTCSLPGCKHK